MYIRRYRRNEAATGALASRPTVTWELKQPRVPMRHSTIIEVDGTFLGVAVAHDLGVRFIAVHVQLKEMDQSIWPTVKYAHQSAKQLFKSGAARPAMAVTSP
jgi:hypothetical protein